MFDNRTILKDIEIDFNEVYDNYEEHLKKELIQQKPYLKKLENLKETFDDFIKKQNNLTFKFEIKNEDFTFYGSIKAYDNFYEALKKNKTFKIEPKDIFFDLYEIEKLQLESKEDKSKEEINNAFIKKQIEINNYFFYIKILSGYLRYGFKIKKSTDHTAYKLEKEMSCKIIFLTKKRKKERMESSNRKSKMEKSCSRLWNNGM